MTNQYANDYPSITPGLGQGFKVYSKIQIIILVLGGSVAIFDIIGYFFLLFSYIYDFYKVFIVLIVLTIIILLGNQILGWIYLKKLIFSLEQQSKVLKNPRFNKAVKQLRFSLNFHFARLIAVILIGVVWIIPEFLPIFNIFEFSYTSVYLLIIISGLCVFGFDLTGSIFRVLAFENIKSWVNESTVRHPQLIEYREIESGLQSLKMGLIFRMISPVLVVSYIGIILSLIGWIIYLVGLKKIADLFFKIETEGYSIAQNPYGFHTYPPQYIRHPQNPRPPSFNSKTKKVPQVSDSESNFCSYCGSRLPPKAKFCVQCGTHVIQ